MFAPVSGPFERLMRFLWSVQVCMEFNRCETTFGRFSRSEVRIHKRNAENSHVTHYASRSPNAFCSIFHLCILSTCKNIAATSTKNTISHIKSALDIIHLQRGSTHTTECLQVHTHTRAHMHAQLEYEST